MHRTASIDARSSFTRYALHIAFTLTLSFLFIACSDGTSPSPVRVVAQVLVDPAQLALEDGDQFSFTAHAFEQAGAEIEGRTIAWSSTNETVASVSSDGVVTALAAGTTTIRATIDGRTGTSNLTVSSAPVATVELSATWLNLFVGASQTIIAVAKDASGRVLSGRAAEWSSSDPDAVSVNSTGLLTANALGTATVSATVEGKVAAVHVTVTPPPIASVVITPSTLAIEVGEQKQLQAVVLDPLGNEIPGKEVLWTVDDASVRITQSGLITGLKSGTITVFATSEGVTGALGGTIANPPPYDFDLVYSRPYFDGLSELLVLDLGTGSAPRRLNAGTVSRTPTASPDGSRIAFAVSMEDLGTGLWIHDIFAVDRNGMNMQRLTNDPGYDEWPEWSPAGGRIAYQHVDMLGRSDIWSMNEDGSGEVNLTGDMISGPYRTSPTWTRDGSRIAFAQTVNDPAGTLSSIWMMNADGSGKRQLTGTRTGFDSSPTWSPDGDRIAFVRYYSGEPDITILDVNTGAATRIPLVGFEANPAWSPDGSLIAFTSGNALYTMQPNGTKVRLRTLDPSWGGGIAPSWISKH